MEYDPNKDRILLSSRSSGALGLKVDPDNACWLWTAVRSVPIGKNYSHCFC